MQSPNDFIHTQGKYYEPPICRGYTRIEVLAFLKGKPWNEIALAYVHAVSPSYIRVIKGEETTDAKAWRVSVYIDRNSIIEKITQEVEVALPDGIQNGYELRKSLDLREK